MRLALVISSLAMGGAERVIVTMANYWANRGWDIALITLAGVEQDWYPVAPTVRRVGCDLMHDSGHLGAAVHQNIQRLRRLRRAVKEAGPDAVISFGDATNVLAVLATAGLGIPVIISERTDPRRHAIVWAWRKLRTLVYRRATALVVQTEAMRAWGSRMVPAERIHVIPNPVACPKRGDAVPDIMQVPERTILGMGRLAREKGFDLLVRAFHACAAMHRDWVLVILGEGEERARLEALAADLGIRDRVILPGRIQDPSAFLHAAALFVMPSRYEGFPNALVEAMAAGLPVIAADCDSGPREIIRPGFDGMLVPTGDSRALAAAMQTLIIGPALRHRLGTNAKGITARFGMEKVMAMWEALILHAITRVPAPKLANCASSS